MRQLTQQLKDGTMELLEVPFPALSPGTVLVRNHYSAISAGTEGKTVRDARLGYLGKARARQKELRQVADSVRSNGLAETYRMVMNKLEAPSALGYSCAGHVIAVGDGVTEFAVGDRVACGGASAVHAEVVSVPKNLCAHVPDSVSLRDASLATVAAIAMQGVRQAEVGLGGQCVVIGLGLIGLLTVKLLNAAGVRVAGIDIDPEQVRLGRSMGAALAMTRDQPGLEEAVEAFGHGAGADAVIITAGTSSLDPVELAGRLCRPKGRVVVVGAVPTGFSREVYYRKELDLRMSCSYGPGRYDAQYEEKGLDYPIGYVRWTENRNMQAYLDLLADGKLDVSPLITHVVPPEQVREAYQMILDRSEPFTAVLIEYDTGRELARRVEGAPRKAWPVDLTLGFIGAGSFAQNVLLPAVHEQASLVGVATARPNNARHVVDRYGFAYATDQAEEVLHDPNISTVFVLTRHDLHAPMVLEALRAGKHVFVEKPLCMTTEQLDEIAEVYAQTDVQLMVGFNRRFAPHVQRVKARFPDAIPKAIHYRINAGVVPPDHWVHDPDVGGGRILGEVCHFVDLCRHLAGAPVTRIAANAMADPHHLQDTVSVTLGFENGSVASIAYFSNGNKQVPKEHLEVYCSGEVAVLDDFQHFTLYKQTERTKDRLRRQDKGHQEEISRFLGALRDGTDVPIPFDEIHEVMRATFKIQESLRSHAMMS